MIKGDILEAVVESISFPNKGILLVDGEKVVVKNVLPGQKIRFVLNRRRKGKCEGRLLEVLGNSALETREDICRQFGTCGGCLYQSIPYETQLRIKKEQVKTLLDGVCGNYLFDGIKGSPVFDGYRNKMEFSFGDEFKDGPLALGMHKRNSLYDIVTTTDCKLVHPDFGLILGATREYFDKAGIGFYRKMQHTGYLRHLLVRRAAKTGETMVALAVSSQVDKLCMEERDLLAGWLNELLALTLEGTFVGILQIVNDSLADVVQSDRTKLLFGREYFYEELLGLRFRISPFSFFQTNSMGAEVLYEKVREYTGEVQNKMVFDLYCGTGTIAQMIAPAARRVVGVEIVEEAVEAAKDNARINNLANCEFIAGDVIKVLHQLEEKPDLIILDPPRDGIHPKALGRIIDFGVNRIVYISCNPTSLVRDLAVLQENGYVVERACAVDLFPQTQHVETVVLLERKAR